jgi:branched-chain amino acid transport system ATP-binding protein
MLRVENLSVSYGAIRALHDVSFEVPQGHIVTLIGSNGAGKSTTLRTISGLIKSTGGQISYEGAAIMGLPAHEIVSRGLPRARRAMVFANLTVRGSLTMGAYLQRDAAVINKGTRLRVQRVPAPFRAQQLAGTLSGGEQQMLAIGRALMGRPRFLMLDEPSLGIAPLLVKAIFQQIVSQQGAASPSCWSSEREPRAQITTFGYVLERAA